MHINEKVIYCLPISDSIIWKRFRGKNNPHIGGGATIVEKNYRTLLVQGNGVACFQKTIKENQMPDHFS